jgi:hypothetical protein
MCHIMYDWPYRIHNVPSPSRPAAVESEDCSIDTAGTTTARERGPGYSDIYTVQGHQGGL